MNCDTVIRQLAEADPFAPGHELPASARPSSVALSHIRRSMDMDTKEAMAPVQSPKPKKRTGLLVAAAAFAAVIVVVGAALLFGNTTSSEPPATTPTTTAVQEATTTEATTTTLAGTTSDDAATTTTVPTLDAEAVAFINEYADLLNRGEHQAAADMVVAAEQWDAPGETDAERELWTRTFLEINSDLDAEYSVDECRALASGTTQCRLTRTAAEIEPIYPHPETVLFGIRFDDGGALAYAGLMPIQTDPWWALEQDFQRWALDTYGTRADSPRQALVVNVDPDTYPVILEDLVSIWRAERNG